MDEFTENRFGNLRELSDEKLLLLKKEKEQEKNSINEDLEDPKVSSQEKTELRNELRYIHDVLRFVEYIQNERNKENEKQLKM